MLYNYNLRSFPNKMVLYSRGDGSDTKGLNAKFMRGKRATTHQVTDFAAHESGSSPWLVQMCIFLKKLFIAPLGKFKVWYAGLGNSLSNFWMPLMFLFIDMGIVKIFCNVVAIFRDWNNVAIGIVAWGILPWFSSLSSRSLLELCCVGFSISFDLRIRS